jgi:hypothetical protein
MQGDYTLKHPIVPKQGDPITAVVLRRPKGKDMKAADKAESDFSGTLILIERLCSLPDGTDVFPGFADELDVEDIETLGERVEAMLPRGQKTGGTT